MGASGTLLLLVAVLVCGSKALLRDPRNRDLALSTTCCSNSRSDHKARCCGEGWGLHCCTGKLCCLGEEVVRPPTQRDSIWEFKHWAQWLNITIVILVIALVTAVLVCCCRRNRAAEKPLRDDYLYTCKYGTAAGEHPSAPKWTQHQALQWIDFSQRPPIPGTPLQYPGSHLPRVRKYSSSSMTDVTSNYFSSSEEEDALLARLKGPCDIR